MKKLQKILWVAVVAVILLDCIDCKTNESRCPHQSVLVASSQTCTSHKVCYPGLCCPNQLGRKYCTTQYMGTTPTTGRCPHQSLVPSSQTCTSHKVCYPGLCCPNQLGRKYCTTQYMGTTSTTGKPGPTKKPSLIGVVKSEIIKHIPSVIPSAIDAVKRALDKTNKDDKTGDGKGFKVERHGGHIHSRQDSFDDEKKRNNNTLTRPQALKSGAGIEMGNHIMMLTVLSTSVIILVN